MPDLPKYIGIEGSHTDFEDYGNNMPLGALSQLVIGNSHDDTAEQLNGTFALQNISWNDDGGQYPHMSELYVRVRDVWPLLEYARDVLNTQAIPDAELQRRADYLSDIK